MYKASILVMTIKYNLLVFLGRVTFVISLIIVMGSLILLSWKGELKLKKKTDVIPLAFGFTMFPIFIISVLKNVANDTYDLAIEDNKLILSRPLIGAKKIIDVDMIKGFSSSEVKFGSHWGISLFRSKSIIIYTAEFGPIELICFNYWEFDKIENKLRELGLTYLGWEGYNRGMFTRKFKFGS
jgi:hypothetical protein